MKNRIKIIIRAGVPAVLALVFLSAQQTARGQGGKPDLSGAVDAVKKIEISKLSLKAAVIVTGDAMDEKKFDQWLKLAVADPKWTGKFGAGLKFTEAVVWLKEHIAGNDGAADRAAAIDNAFREVYGRESTPTEQAFWETQVRAQKAWYATIVGGEIGKLNANAAVRTETIKRSFQAAFGRQPADKEMQYWLPRSEHFRLMLDAQRAYLYSPNGADELVATVKRRLLIKNGALPSNAQIKQALIFYTPLKAIYREM